MNDTTKATIALGAGLGAGSIPFSIVWWAGIHMPSNPPNEWLILATFAPQLLAGLILAMCHSERALDAAGKEAFGGRKFSPRAVDAPKRPELVQ